LRQGLSEEGHAVTVAGDGAEGLSMAEAGGFDVIVLDVMLPKMDGMAVARRLRAGRNQTPILMLTARDATADIVEGLNLGADDYLTKPFSFDVLCARVKAVGRRGPIAQPVRVEVADLRLDLGSGQVQRGVRQIALTRTEYAILEILARNAGRVVTRQSLMESVWGAGAEVENNTLDAFVRLLRGKVDAPGEARLIHTVRGFGYTLKAEAP
jgi:DNA-binding response OmpR family regulator